MTRAHERLDPRIQRWIYKQGWEDLRPIQKEALGPVLSASCDVLICASTASGKTEAFFLPALSMSADQEDGFSILYLSPLKALINDQYRRLSGLCDELDMPLTSWHGDSNQAKKQAMRKKASGVILTTPESLEAMLINHAGWAKKAFSKLKYVVIDEFHAFIGTERGLQLVSLLHRLEHLTGRAQQPIPRVALSATLGEIDSVPLALRPNQSIPCQIVLGSTAGNSMQMQLHGYLNPIQAPVIYTKALPTETGEEPVDDDEDELEMSANEEYITDFDDDFDEDDPDEEQDQTRHFDAKSLPLLAATKGTQPMAQDDHASHTGHPAKRDRRVKRDGIEINAQYNICTDIYVLTRGSSNLVFANSRSKTEVIANTLNEMCLRNFVPNEYFPHHGSMAKEMREGLEARLQQSSLPTTAICTMTLELGIDIGNIDAVYQVYPPSSISGLRQRLGRSGRRDGNSVLRVMIPEDEIGDTTPLTSLLRIGLFQSVAMLHLLIKHRWYEPADSDKLHLSTLLQQTLAVIAQYGSIRAEQLFRLLCHNGPFKRVNTERYMALLRDMGKAQLITQMQSGELTLGTEGELLVGDFHFYAAFNAPEEYRLIHRGKYIGSLPLDIPLLTGQRLIFSGKKWIVKQVNEASKEIMVARSRNGKAPAFVGSEMTLHSRIRQEMKQIYLSGQHEIEIGSSAIGFMDEQAIRLFNEGLTAFRELKLHKRELITHGAQIYLFTWEGDKVVNTLVGQLMTMGITASSFAGVIEIDNCSIEEVTAALRDMAQQGLLPAATLASHVESKEVEKYDGYLSDENKNHNYAAIRYDREGAMNWLEGWLSRQE